MKNIEIKAEATSNNHIDPLEASFDLVDKIEAQESVISQLSESVDGVKSDVESVKTRLDKVASAAARPALSNPQNGGNVEGKKSLYSSAASRSFVDGYLRSGRETELKSLSIGSGADGGFAVPREIDTMIGRMLTNISPIRAIANVVQTGSAGYRKLVTTGGTPSGWASDSAPRPMTATPNFVEIAPPTGDLYANPAASQAMLDDAAFDVENWLSGEIAAEFARAEAAAFINGTGVNQPKGFLTGPTTLENDNVRAFGTLQYIPSGAAGAFAAANPQDKIVDLIHALKPAYRQGAVFVMNSATVARIRKMKTSDGAFLWQPSMAVGQPATLLGYPVIEAEDMPDVAANSLSIAFGNFNAGYLIAERSSTSILRDPYSNKPFVHFYATKRVGGQLMNSDAIKVMKFAAS
ncbi:phage capsid protein [Sphingorhabdus lutea]|uniref:Phage capsid protein n=1 Tax=Sphingorhabdus lutea TaxID=1913578 RepID=A0A1L3JDM3_9SPHN|nr:phage major capsid protein [Sphingorhabdus lutea]APG63247.1 phage capsid protein [Sphingorhabdus lutea]